MERDTVYPANVDEKETEQEEDRSANVTNEEIDMSQYHESYYLDLALSQLVRPVTPLIWHPNEPRHINELNEHCMQNIFKLFPSQSLIQLRGVCRKWFWDIHRLLRSKRSIKLIGDNSKENFCYCPDLPKYLDRFGEFKFYLNLKRDDDDDLAANSIEINALPRLFPNITRLVVCIYRDKFLHNLDTVIRMWSKLEVLTLYNFDVFHERMDNLWSIIDALSGLKELHLLGMKFGIEVPPLVNTLRQLESFTYLSETRQFVSAEQLLSQLGPQLRRLFLYGIHLPLEDFEWFCRSNSSTVHNLTHLTIGKVGDHFLRDIDYQPWCRLIATHMTSLTYLSIFTFQENENPYPSCSFELLNELSELKLLEELSLNYFSTSSLPDIEDCRQLSSVKRLWLNVEGIYNFGKFFKLISFIFPALEMFNILSNNDCFLNGIKQCRKNEADLRRYFPQMQPKNFQWRDSRWYNLDNNLELFSTNVFPGLAIKIYFGTRK